MVTSSLYDIALTNTLEDLLGADLSQEGFRMLLLGLLLRYRFSQDVMHFIRQQLKKGKYKDEV